MSCTFFHFYMKIKQVLQIFCMFWNRKFKELDEFTIVTQPFMSESYADRQKVHFLALPRNES